MALMLGSLYDALIAANAPPEKALKAAEEAAAYETSIGALRGEIAEVKSDLRILKWMTGLVLAGIVSVILGLTFP